MAKSINRVTLLGRIGKDAETKFMTSGNACTRFSIATTRSYKQGDTWQEQTNWTDVCLWGNEKLAQYLTKGKQVYVDGRLETRSYDKDGEKKYVTEVVVDNVVLCGGADAGGKRQESHPSSEVDDKDIPF